MESSFFRKFLCWKTIFFAVCVTSLTCLYFEIWQSERWYNFQLDRKINEIPQCKPLLEVARRILNGEKIPLPYSDNETLWKFKERVNKSTMLKNMKYQHKEMESMKIQMRYNVTVSDIKTRKLFITFAHNCCLKSRQRAIEKARTVGGFDYVRAYNLSSISMKFRKSHEDVLKVPRGAGYWLWKPYILLKTLLENMNDGELVMYQDAGAYLIRSAGPLLKLCEVSKYGILIFYVGLSEQDYTKKDAMILMNMSIPEASETFQRMASFLVMKKSCTSIQFVMEWLAYLSDRRLASDDGNAMGFPNVKSFKGHRHDQSVLSLLSKKWGILGMRNPADPNWKRDFMYGPYERIIVHDRWRH